jgi:hypothetical protein
MTGLDEGDIDNLLVLAERFPPGQRPQGVSWSAFEVLARAEDRFDLLARMAADPDWPEGWQAGRRAKNNRVIADRARLAVGQKVDRKAISDAEQILAAMENEQVRKDVLMIEARTRGERNARALAERREKELAREAEREERERQADERRRVQDAERAERQPRPKNPLEYVMQIITRMRGLNVAMAEAVGIAGRLPARPSHYREQMLDQAYEAIRLAGKIVAILDPEAPAKGQLADPNLVDL